MARLFLFVLLALSLSPNAFGDAAQKTALLPRGVEFGGVVLKVDAVGFGAPTDVNPDKNLRANRTTGFYFSYLVLAQNAALSERLDGAALLTGLFAPDGTPLRPSAATSGASNVTEKEKGVGRTLFFSDVLPTWKSVRAEFEVRNLLAPPQDAGVDRSPRRFEAIPLPAPIPGEKIATSTPELSFETERSTQVKLIKIERESGKENLETGRVRFFWSITPPASATNYKVEMQNGRVDYDVPDASEGASERKQFTDSTEIKLEALNVPAAAKSAALSFDLVESARAWRKKSAFSLISFEIPVAKVWEAAPLALQTPPVAPVVAKNADFEATWESLGDTSGGWMQNHSRLWMRDLDPDAALGAWTPKSVEFQNGATTQDLFSWATASEGVFHSDNSLRREGELGYSLSLNLSDTTPENADLVVKAQCARTFLHAHTLKNVPLPAPNTMREYGPNEFDDGIWKLRRATWLEGDAAFKAALGFSEDGLILTFERDPQTAFQGDNMMLTESIFYDEKGVFDVSSSTFFDGEPSTIRKDPGLFDEGEKTRISLMISLPARGATHWSGNFQVWQQLWSGPIQTLIVPAVPLVPTPKG